MTTNTSLTGELLYEEVIQFTRITEYGVSVKEILSGKVQIPPQGIRVDIGFEGKLLGPKLKGTIAGTDYIRITADGQFQLSLHGTIHTDDDVAIAFDAEGMAISQTGETAIGKVTQNVTLTTAVTTYSWVNDLQIWVKGIADFSKGEVKLKGYAV
jgi:hypothetical protein